MHYCFPAPSLDVPRLKENFARIGCNTRDMVVLSGAHTVNFQKFDSPSACPKRCFRPLSLE